MSSLGLSWMYTCVFLNTHSFVYILIFHCGIHLFIYTLICMAFVYFCKVLSIILFMFLLVFMYVCICSYILFYTWFSKIVYSWWNILVYMLYTLYMLPCILVHFNRFVQFPVGYSGFLIAPRETLDLFCSKQRVVYPRELWMVSIDLWSSRGEIISLSLLALTNFNWLLSMLCIYLHRAGFELCLISFPLNWSLFNQPSHAVNKRHQFVICVFSLSIRIRKKPVLSFDSDRDVSIRYICYHILFHWYN